MPEETPSEPAQGGYQIVLGKTPEAVKLCLEGYRKEGNKKRALARVI